jgi:hypothetical protein
MRPSARELWWALGIIGGVSVLYAALVSVAGVYPQSSGPVGHGLGVVGFILMLMTETLYSLRKRSRLARWGRPAGWLRFHIVTGLVGSYLVLLHAAWRYNGLAGLVMLMTLVVVTSGFVGRYIYTRVPRNGDGLMVEASELQAQAEATRLALASGATGSKRELRRLTARQRQLERQAASIVTVRRAMGVWTSVHIPLGVALFTAAFVHIIAALYYATFSH